MSGRRQVSVGAVHVRVTCGQQPIRTVGAVSIHPLGELATASDLGAPRVQVLRWPAEAARRDPAAPCLWLLPLGELPPLAAPGDDWVRLPVDERDLRARLARLAGSGDASGSLRPGDVRVDRDGRVERCGAVVHLPPIEAHLLTVLASTPERVVTRSALIREVWGSDGPSGRALDSRIHALRRHLGPLGLVVHTIRGRGFLLAASSPTGDDRPGSRR